MKHWGIAISALYAVVVAALTLPLWIFLFFGELNSEALADLLDSQPLVDFLVVWGSVGLFIVTQAALLFIAVDRSGSRLKPRRRLGIAVAATSFAVALLCLAVLSNVIAILLGDDGLEWEWFWLALPAVLWIGWGVVFYLYRERMFASLTRTVGWLLNGSVLQLLIAVPAHIVVRERNDCCAPMISGFGIASGVALMLMAFGPSVVFLYQDRLRRHERRNALPLLAKWPIRTLLATFVIGGALLWPVLQPDGRESVSPPPAATPAAESP